MEKAPVSNLGWRQRVSQAGQLVASAAGPHLLRLWQDPVLSRERQARPLPGRLLSQVLPVAAGLLTLLPILAWAIDSRLVSAVILGLCLGAASLPVLAAPIAGALTASSARDQSTFTAASPTDAARGSMLAAVWRLRWLIVVGLALTPALVISLLRLDFAAFSAYRESVLALGSAAPPEQVRLLLPGGDIPYFRLAIRDLSGGLLPWAALPTAVALGLSGALVFDDVTFGQIVGLISALVVSILTALVWAWLSLTPIFAGLLEIVRLALLGGLLAGLVWLSSWVTRLNARLLLTR